MRVQQCELPARAFWLWVPVIWLIAQILVELLWPANFIQQIHSENSFYEFLQFIIIFAAFILCLYTLIHMDRKAQSWLSAWIIFATICCFYVTFEEISWGQSFFLWETPEYWAEINQQYETNLHNTTRWLNQIPRYGLMAGIAVGGLIIPAIQFLKPTVLPTKFKDIYPPNTLIITAICLLVVALGHKMAKTYLDIKFFARSSEVEEIYAYYFVLLYMCYLKDRILNRTSS